jgi:mannosyl-glycoprotein endo-beta-N-acetylglucosaminidase
MHIINESIVLFDILGTLITEWDDGYKLCHKFLESPDSLKQLVDQMVKIAKYYHFEGWLVNIENQIEVSFQR